jgi:beta-lactamase class A
LPPAREWVSFAQKEDVAMVARRDFLVGAMALVSAAPLVKAAALSARSPGSPLENRIRELERKSGGRLGVALIDTGSHRRFAWRGDERFPLASTFKFLLAAQMLSRADRGEERLARRLPIRGSRLDNSPFTKSRVGRDASLGELCKAIVAVSDNDAANLLLAEAGGSAAVTRFARLIGDPVTRLDRSEPALGAAVPGDPRDTTSPTAMAADFERLLLGSVLQPASRATLTGWLQGVRTGVRRLPAGIPAGWRIGHKTGTGMRGTSNDVAILWPGRRPPLILSVYLTESRLDEPGRDGVIADVARAVAASV